MTGLGLFGMIMTLTIGMMIGVTMTGTFEGYSEAELKALVNLGLIDRDLVEDEVKPLDISNSERESINKETPHITVKKNRDKNSLYVDMEEAKMFGPGDVGKHFYLQFIYDECRKPQNADMIIKGTYKTLSYFNKKYPDIFNGLEMVAE